MLRKSLVLAALIMATAGIVWYTWPRPDTLIRVQRGGVAVVTDIFGRHVPLPDTVYVGGRGRSERFAW